ncbi:FimD/PapC N-terminal domain-containing protein [Budvicia aquatica]|uniref:Outer membrane usher protein fimD n=1 Tax=Budvicia aquatica TaxID=82979 RepID=A0A484ZGQ7_9GAMM|nr:FimD/PapC N-terminal domain-containing protein [Budvicia aquatica]VFS47692.1 Outer membrane usher protein fimD precursor [Budvicia aquatica]
MPAFNRSLSPLTAAVLLALAGGAAADDNNDAFEFNPYFMSPGSQQRIDLSRYNQDLTPVGSYRAELVVNGKRVGRDEVIIKDRLVEGKAVSKVDICIKPSTLAALDINLEKLSDQAQRQIKGVKEGECLALNQLLPENSIDFDTNDQILNLNLPQVYLINRPRGYVNQNSGIRGSQQQPWAITPMPAVPIMAIRTMTTYTQT